MRKIIVLQMLLLFVFACSTKVVEEKQEKQTSEDVSELNLTVSVNNVTIESTTNNLIENLANENKVNVSNEISPEFSELKKHLNFDFEIYYPKPGLVLHGPLLSLTLSLENFSLAKSGDKNKWGYGYFLVRFDGDPTVHVMEKSAKTFRGLSAGERRVFVEAVQSDGKSYGIIKSTTFIVPETGIAESGDFI